MSPDHRASAPTTEPRGDNRGIVPQMRAGGSVPSSRRIHSLLLLLRRILRSFTSRPGGQEGAEGDGRLDLRSLSIAATAWTSAWVLVQMDPGVSLLLTAILGAMLAMLYWLLLRNRGIIAWSHHWWAPVAAAAVGAFLVAAGISTHVLAQRDPTFGALADAGATIRFTAAVTGDARTMQSSYGNVSGESLVGAEPSSDASAPLMLVDVRVDRYTADGHWHAGAAEAVLVLRSEQWQQDGRPTVGQTVSGLGRLARAEPGDRQGYWLQASTTLAPVDGEGRRLPTEDWRERLAGAATILPGEGPALLPGMVMGDRTAQSEELSADMKTTGLAHLTAVSGANVAMILGTVLYACRFFGIRRWPSLGLSLLLLVGFVILVHPEPSVIRAAIMGAIGALAVYAGRGKQALTTLCICVVLILAWDPWYAREPAFQLSALATAGIVLMGQRLAGLCRHIMPGWLADGVGISTSAQLFCLPVLLGMSSTFSPYSVPANVLAAPLVPVVTVAGTAALLLAGLPGPWLQPFIWVAGVPASWIGSLGHLVAGLPGSALAWPEGPAGRAAGVLVSVLALMAVWLASTPPVDENAASHGWLGDVGTIGRRTRALINRVPLSGDLSGWGRRGAAISVGAAGLGLLAGLTMPTTALLPAPSGPWQLAACDVGQGDAFVLRSGAHSAVLVDTGPDPAMVDNCLTELGIRDIDALFITHLHADHAGGLSGAVNDRTVGPAYFSTGTERTTLPGLSPDHETSEPPAGTRGTAGTVSWEILGPLEDPVGEEENNASLVVVFTLEGDVGRPFTMLATGDMESEAMGAVLRAHEDLHVDVLKVSHHGAKNGGSAVIAASGARVALIGVGADNTYGHPAPSILQALRTAGIEAFRTDLHGTIRLQETATGQLVVHGHSAG